MLEKALQRDMENRPFEKEIRKFTEIVITDPNLLEQLDATPDKNSFIDMYCLLAKQRDIHFTKDDMLIAVQEQKQGSNWILHKKILKMVAERF